MRSSSILLALVLLFSPLTTHGAVSGEYDWEQFSKRLTPSREVAPLGENPFGEAVSLSNGALSFAITDVSLPGTSALPVSVGRTYEVFNRRWYVSDGAFADWHLDAPSISAVSTGAWLVADGTGESAQRCSLMSIPRRPPNFEVNDFWTGITLDAPGGGEVLATAAGTQKPTDGATYRWMTAAQTHLTCLPSIKNGIGEGFLAVAADGTRYWFDWMASYVEPHLEGVRVDPQGENKYYQLPRKKTALYATRVEDRFGNRVDYTYTNAANQRARLTQISASDGRTLSLTYNAQGEIATVSDGSRQWTYSYGSTPQGRRTLTSVQQPDGHSWGLAMAPLTDGEIRYNENPLGEPLRDCTVNETPINFTAEPVGTLTHPSGLVGQYRMGLREHGSSNVPVNCLYVTTTVGEPAGSDNNTQDDVNLFPHSAWSWTLLSRTFNGPGLAPATWSYGYDADLSMHWFPGQTVQFPVCTLGAQCYQPPCTSDACAGSSRTTITRPDGTWERHTYGNSFQYNEGKLLAIDVGQGANVVQTTRQAYNLAPGGTPFPASYGTSTRGWDGVMASKNLPLVARHIERDGVRFSNEHTVFDAFTRPTSTIERSVTLQTGAVRATRTAGTSYFDDPSRWVMGQVARSTMDGIETERVTFDSRSLPSQVFVFGARRYTLAYHADGAVHTITDGRNHTLTLSQWYRGVPRAITYPDSTSMSAVVTPQGWVTSATDQNGFVTGYTYDPMGRLTQVTPPSGDPVTYTATTIQYKPLNPSTDWLPPGTASGQWRRLEQRGNYVSATYFDALFRPVLALEYDNADINGTTRSTRTAYDLLGRPSFTSYPVTGSGTTSAGTRTQYDPLGRVTRVEQDSELGPLVTQTAYLTNFRMQVTDPKLQATTTSYLAYGEPTTDWPTEILQPEGTTTLITRETPFAKPTAITRSGGGVSLIRRYAYDARQRLCKQIDPETQATIFDYDGSDNVIWTATGLGLTGSASSCDREWVGAADKTVRTYDPMNRLTLVDFPDATIDTGTTYTPDGLVSVLSAGPHVWRYTYNRLRLPTRELLEHTYQGLIYPYSTDWSYNALGHRSTMSAGNGLSVNYAPNALGQPTRAGTFATGARYFPDGALQSFTYGNGAVRTVEKNTRLLPSRIADLLPGQTLLDDRYTYDANGNLTHQDDALNLAGGDRTLNYDGRDRLLSAQISGVPTETFTYDALDNILSRQSGSQVSTYSYDSVTRRLSGITGPGGTQTFAYDPRGNMTSRANLSHSFDRANRLTAVSGRGTYEYDGHGRRTMSWRTDGTGKMDVYTLDGVLRYTSDSRRGGATVYIHLGSQLVAERFANWDGTNGVTEYVHGDLVGSAVARTAITAFVTERERSLSYGQALDGSKREAPGFTGHMEDPTLGLVYMQQRYYDPAIGRFLSVDPVGPLDNPIQHFGRYHYAANNPYRFIDPDGRMVRNRHEAPGMRDRGSCDTFIVCLNSREDGELPRPLRSQGYEAIGDGYVVRVDDFNSNGESKFEVHVYKDSRAFREAAALRNSDALRKAEVNVLGLEGQWGKHGHPSTEPNLGSNGQAGLNKVVSREINKRGWTTRGSDGRIRLRDNVRRNLGRYSRFLGPAGVALEYTRTSVDRGCEINPSSEAC